MPITRNLSEPTLTHTNNIFHHELRQDKPLFLILNKSLDHYLVFDPSSLLLAIKANG